MAEERPSDLADAVLAFVRSFGLHRAESTPCGMPVSVAEAHALLELTDGGVGQSELGLRLALTKSTVSRLVNGLLDRGWLERTPDPHDGRAARLALSEEGRRAATRLGEARQARFRGLLDAIPPERRGEVRDALTTLTDAARRSDPRHG